MITFGYIWHNEPFILLVKYEKPIPNHTFQGIFACHSSTSRPNVGFFSGSFARLICCRGTFRSFFLGELPGTRLGTCLGNFSLSDFSRECSCKPNSRSKLLMLQAQVPHSVPKVAENEHVHSSPSAQVAHQADERDRGGATDAVGAQDVVPLSLACTDCCKRPLHNFPFHELP